MAVAGRRGFAHYSFFTRKWKLFGNITQVCVTVKERVTLYDCLFQHTNHTVEAENGQSRQFSCLEICTVAGGLYLVKHLFFNKLLF